MDLFILCAELQNMRRIACWVAFISFLPVLTFECTLQQHTEFFLCYEEGADQTQLHTLAHSYSAMANFFSWLCGLIDLMAELQYWHEHECILFYFIFLWWVICWHAIMCLKPSLCRQAVDTITTRLCWQTRATLHTAFFIDPPVYLICFYQLPVINFLPHLNSAAAAADHSHLSKVMCNGKRPFTILTVICGFFFCTWVSWDSRPELFWHCISAGSDVSGCMWDRQGCSASSQSEKLRPVYLGWLCECFMCSPQLLSLLEQPIAKIGVSKLSSLSQM